MKNKRIAIIGGGGMGVCTALELARRGYQIDIYEQSDSLVKKASYANEGKIHLGLIYAMDDSLSTTRQMIEGALHFMTYLKKWINIDAEGIISTPFYYLNHMNSLMTSDQLMGHYKKCIQLFKAGTAFYKMKYLDLFDDLKVDQIHNFSHEWFDSDVTESVFETSEYAVDIRVIADKLAAAVNENDRINAILNCEIQEVGQIKNQLQIEGFRDGVRFDESYDIVINSSWNGRLEIDKSMGISPPYQWSHRYKLANRVIGEFGEKDFPSVTIVQGPFGDTVNFKENGMFFSWYPIGRMGWSEELRPPEWDDLIDPKDRNKASVDSLTELKNIIPVLSNLSISENDIDPVGGVIYALGNKEVDRVESRLHTRYEVGLQSFGNYHSVNTGKYTLIPLLAMEIADKITS